MPYASVSFGHYLPKFLIFQFTVVQTQWIFTLVFPKNFWTISIRNELNANLPSKYSFMEVYLLGTALLHRNLRWAALLYIRICEPYSNMSTQDCNGIGVG